LLKVLSVIGLMVVWGCVNTSAGVFGIGGNMSWKEEVLLHDGGIIIAERFYNIPL
jgi:hypothetical protein